MLLIEGKSINFSYSKTSSPILQEVNFEIEKGRCNLFIGKSGSGKTTLLRCLANLLPIGGDLICSDSLKIGFVSQTWDLFPHMTVLENCVHPQKHVLKRSLLESQERAKSTLDSLGILGLANHYPNQLSGGQKQRLAIARALGMDAEVLLLDEPTSALDPITTQQFRSLLEKLQKEGLTLVISTHDVEFIKSYLDKIYFIKEGKIISTFDAKKEILPPESIIYQYIYGIFHEKVNF